MKKLFIITLISILAAIPASTYAVKAYSIPTIVTQSDGSKITVRTFGDENFHYSLTCDNVVLCHVGYDYFIADVNADNEIRPTSILAHEPELRTSIETAAVNKQRKLNLDEMAATKMNQVMMREPVINTTRDFPHTGSPKALVLLVQFADTVFSLENPYSTFYKYLNADTLVSNDGAVSRNHGSVRRYFSDCSFGALTPKFDVYGPFTLSQTSSYYGNGSDNDGALVQDACKAADDSVNFADYDANKDGKVDLVYIIFAGYSESISGNSSNCIWPRSGNMSGGSYDGVAVNQFGLNNELNGYPGAYSKEPYKRCNGIGLFCHEFTHCMGLPDFYPTSSSAQTKGNSALEYWDLMDGGEYCGNGYYPAPYSAWERESMGWMTIDTLTEAANITLKTIDNGGKAYRIINDADATGQEYYILENRQNTGWNKKAYGHGLLVYHVDYNSTAFNPVINTVNNTIGHSRMTLIAADGKVLSSYLINDSTITQTDYFDNMASDPFPGTKGVTALTDTSAVAATVYTGSYMHKPITEISESEDGTITFKFMGGEMSAIHDINDTPTSVTSDNRIFTIDGRYAGENMNVLKKGLYIRNHQMIIKN